MPDFFYGEFWGLSGFFEGHFGSLWTMTLPELGWVRGGGLKFGKVWV